MAALNLCGPQFNTPYENPVDRPHLRSRNVSQPLLYVDARGELKADLDLPGDEITMSETRQINIGDTVALESADHLGERFDWKANTDYTVTGIDGDCVSSLDNKPCMLSFDRFVIRQRKEIFEFCDCGPWSEAVRLHPIGDRHPFKKRYALSGISPVPNSERHELLFRQITSAAPSVPARTESAPASE